MNSLSYAATVPTPVDVGTRSADTELIGARGCAMAAFENRTAVRTRVDVGIGWVIQGDCAQADVRAVQHQALDAVADHIRNPEVQTIVIADFNAHLVAASASGDPDPYDAVLADRCHEVTEMLWSSSKTLVLRRHADRAMPSAISTTPVYIEPLTQRERQVLSMACDGASARVIGRQLFISERTVESHVSNGYRKLGIRSRIELVRRAAEFGL